MAANFETQAALRGMERSGNRELVAEDKFERTLETVGKINSTELMRYKIGSNGIRYRVLVVEDCAIVVMGAGA